MQVKLTFGVGYIYSDFGVWFGHFSLVVSVVGHL